MIARIKVISGPPLPTILASVTSHPPADGAAPGWGTYQWGGCRAAGSAVALSTLTGTGFVLFIEQVFDRMAWEASRWRRGVEVDGVRVRRYGDGAFGGGDLCFGRSFGRRGV